MKVKNQDKTLSTLFLLPVLGLTKEHSRKFGLINAYIKVKEHEPRDKYSIYLIYKVPPDRQEDFKDYIDYNLADNPNFNWEIESSFTNNDDIKGLLFTIPEKFKKDYDLFLEGKYSKLSKEFKAMFPDTKNIYDENGNKEGREYTIYHHIFNKTEWLRDFMERKYGAENIEPDMELWDKPDIEKETFYIDKYK